MGVGTLKALGFCALFFLQIASANTPLDSLKAKYQELKTREQTINSTFNELKSEHPAHPLVTGDAIKKYKEFQNAYDLFNLEKLDYFMEYHFWIAMII